MGEECKHFWELFLVGRLFQSEDGLTAPRLILVTVVREKRMQSFFFLPNEGKGRRECSLSGQDEPGLLWLKSMRLPERTGDR